jgi:hypothetical protein
MECWGDFGTVVSILFGGQWDWERKIKDERR